MKINNIYIQKYLGEFPWDFCYAAYVGADKLGMKPIFFEDIMEVPANRNNLVITNVGDTKSFFMRCDIEVPKAMNVFELLPNKVGRSFEYMKLGEFVASDIKDIFIKPLNETKGFPSGVYSKEKKSLLFGEYDQDMDVVLSEKIDIVSEYRLFYSKKWGIMGMKHYLGDPFLVPDRTFVLECIDELAKRDDLFESFTLDFGILSDGTTTVIEANDAWSIGSYGFEGGPYVMWLWRRWNEIMNKKIQL